MDWADIRAHYTRLYEALGQTQEAVAARSGGIVQNDVSRLLRNRHRGPSVQTFVRAVEGMGLTLGAFFAELDAAAAAQRSSSAAAAAHTQAPAAVHQSPRRPATPRRRRQEPAIHAAPQASSAHVPAAGDADIVRRHELTPLQQSLERIEAYLLTLPDHTTPAARGAVGKGSRPQRLPERLAK